MSHVFEAALFGRLSMHATTFSCRINANFGEDAHFTTYDRNREVKYSTIKASRFISYALDEGWTGLQLTSNYSEYKILMDLRFILI